jgi:rSAM/selenodomain-associated transferase 2
VNTVPITYRYSIIIPVLHEAQWIHAQLELLRKLEADEPFEIIVVDGSPTQDTLQAIQNTTVKKYSCRQGRGAQMNYGAAQASGDILVFLHVDTFLPKNALSLIRTTLQDLHCVGGGFSLQIQSNNMLLRMTAALSTLRSQIMRIPYGDQVIFLRKSFFDAIGGYKEIPLMEDVELMRRIRKMDKKIVILPTKVLTSDRRWNQEGLFYATIRNSIIIVLYFFGVPAEKLAATYPWQPPDD